MLYSRIECVRCFKRVRENVKKRRTPGSGCLSGRRDHQVTRPWEDGPSLPLVPSHRFLLFRKLSRTDSSHASPCIRIHHACNALSNPLAAAIWGILERFQAFSHQQPRYIWSCIGLRLLSLLYEPFPPSFTAESCVAEIDFGLCGSNLAPSRFLKQMGALSVAPFFGFFFFSRGLVAGFMCPVPDAGFWQLWVWLDSVHEGPNCKICDSLWVRG